MVAVTLPRVDGKWRPRRSTEKFTTTDTEKTSAPSVASVLLTSTFFSGCKEFARRLRLRNRLLDTQEKRTTEGTENTEKTSVISVVSFSFGCGQRPRQAGKSIHGLVVNIMRSAAVIAETVLRLWLKRNRRRRLK